MLYWGTLPLSSHYQPGNVGGMRPHDRGYLPQGQDGPLGVQIPKGPSGSGVTILPAGIGATSRTIAGEPPSTGQEATSHRRAKSSSKDGGQVIINQLLPRDCPPASSGGQFP